MYVCMYVWPEAEEKQSKRTRRIIGGGGIRKERVDSAEDKVYKCQSKMFFIKHMTVSRICII